MVLGERVELGGAVALGERVPLGGAAALGERVPLGAALKLFPFGDKGPLPRPGPDPRLLVENPGIP